MTKSVRLVAALLLAMAGPAHGQSLFGSAGLGIPLDGLDGRARALGSLGIGLGDAMLLPSDPAAAAGVLFPTVSIVVQPTWVDLTDPGTNTTHYFRGSRFPLFSVAYPLLQGVATLQLSSFLDQDFEGQRSVSVSVGGVPAATDTFRQDGTVARMTLGYSRRVSESFAAGVTLGRYVGSLSRSLTRDFDASSSVVGLEPYVSSGRWSYSGYTLAVGFASDPTDILHVAGSATWSSGLEATASSETEAGDRQYDVPLDLRLGATAALVPGLSLHASVLRADWSGTKADLINSGAHSTVGFGTGLELSQFRLLGRAAPLRLGYRRASLPFSLDAESVSERAFTGGLGLTLNESNGQVLATMDVGVERGLRSGGTFEERFWRGTLSIRATGL